MYGYQFGEFVCGQLLSVDCKQSLLVGFSKGIARARQCRSHETGETRVAASPVLRLPSRAWSFLCLTQMD